MVSQLDLVSFVRDHSDDRTHPDGCMAITGITEDPQQLMWVVLVNLCPHDHPRTNAGLTQQYADNGWVNIDAERPEGDA